MAFTGGVFLTNGGRRLLSLAQAGETLTFTRFELGDGVLSGLEIERAALVSPKDGLPVSRLRANGDGTATIGALRDASALGGYYFRELGLWARDPEAQGAEILYAYANAGASAEYLPEPGGAEIVEQVINLIVSIGNAPNVTAVIASGIYLTEADLAWDKISGKPATYPPSAHATTHANGGADPISPTAIGAAPASHTHTQAQITGLPAALAGKAVTALYTVNVPTTGWATGTGQYTRTLAVAGILAADNPVCDVALSATAATRANQIKAWAAVELITTAAGSITIYASAVPTVELTLRIKVVR